MNARAIIENIALNLQIGISELIRVREEDVDVDNVKHICRHGFFMLERKHIEVTVPVDPTRLRFKQVYCDLWNCPYCGKTYYFLRQEDMTPMRLA
jgi:hypothetical protein